MAELPSQKFDWFCAEVLVAESWEFGERYCEIYNSVPEMLKKGLFGIISPLQISDYKW